MRQRVVIAIALACDPAVLLADEPTTALDVTIQAQVLGLLDDLKRRHGMAVVFITHNMGVVAQIADRVAVMYAGQVVEEAPVAPSSPIPRTPTPRALFAAIPRLDRADQELAAIPGRVPPLDAMPRAAASPPAARCGRRGATAAAARAHRAGHRCRCHVMERARA